MLNVKKIFFYTLFLFLIISCKTVFANDYYFEEDFNGNYSDINNWPVIVNHLNRGIIDFNANDGYLTLGSHRYNFPFLVSKNIFPQSNFDLEIKFKYLSVGDYGAGIVLSNDAPNYFERIDDSDLFYIWEDKANNFLLRNNTCLSNGGSCNNLEIFHSTNPNNDLSEHIVNIVYKNDKYYFYMDSVLLYESSVTNFKPNNVWLGNPYQVGNAAPWSSFAIDYIRVKELPIKELDVPFYSQNDSLWGTDEYDHANDWIDVWNLENTEIGTYDDASPFINRWGCAMVSMAMLYRYYDMDLIPFIYQDMNPKNLNYWLTNKPQQEGLVGNSVGYQGDGDISWIALNQLARFYNPYYSLEILEGDLSGYAGNFKTFKENIDDGRPEILRVSGSDEYWKGFGGHYIVGKGYDNEYFYINDPENPEAGEDKAPLDYGITQRIALFKDPSWKDWGKVNIHHKDDIKILIEDSEGKKLGEDGEGNSYNEITYGSYIKGGLRGGTSSESNSTNVYLSRVATGSAYRITAFGDEGKELDLLMQTLNTNNSAYDSSVSASFSGEGKAEFDVIFSDDENNSLEEIVPVSYESVAQFINEQYEIGNIKHKGLMKLLLNYLRLSEKFYENGNSKLANLFLNQFVNLLDKVRINKQMELETRDELIEMLGELKENLE